MAERHPSNTTGKDVPPDTSKHARTWHASESVRKGDEVYIYGEGFYMSNCRVETAQSDAREACKKRTESRATDQGMGHRRETEYGNQLISEETILAWARHIAKERTLRGKDTNHPRDQRKAYDARCYPGTDTEDRSKNDHQSFNQRNQFDVDHSNSSLIITVSSGDQQLNGSIVRHQHTIHMTITCPDGRHYCDLYMSMDQFAAALVSSREIPCTLSSYWDVNEANVLMREVVKKPDTVTDRVEQRVRDSLGVVGGHMEVISKKLKDAMAAGKPLGKTALAEITKDFENFMGHFSSNTDFAVRQAREEASHVVESAAIAVLGSQALPPGAKETLANSVLKDLLGEGRIKRLEAHVAGDVHSDSIPEGARRRLAGPSDPIRVRDSGLVDGGPAKGNS